MSEALDGDGREKHGHLGIVTEDANREVDVRNVYKRARLELEALECFAVAAERDLVIGPARDVVEERLRELSAGAFLVVEDVQEGHAGIVAPAVRAVIRFW
jgi:hypothetical protein